jgi:branched-chain amino acid transport system ATP-binding protein
MGAGSLPRPNGTGEGTAVLDVQGATKRYGSKTIVDDVTFVVGAGECLGIIGPNGAGKTTLFHVLDGTVSADAGRILLEGEDIVGLAQYRRARLGVGRAYQIPRVFVGLTVYENVLAGTLHAAMPSAAAPRAREILETVGLADKSNRPAAALSLLDRKRLELARAMSVGSKILLLDEIAGGLTEQEVFELVELVRALKQGHAVLWIEHIPHALTAVADRIMVLHAGAKLIEGHPLEVMDTPVVQEIYLGIQVDEPAHT